MLGFEFATGVSVAAIVGAAARSDRRRPGSRRREVAVIVTATDALLDGSATLVAVSSTVGGEGNICGAMKTPLDVTVPHALPDIPRPECPTHRRRRPPARDDIGLKILLRSQFDGCARTAQL